MSGKYVQRKWVYQSEKVYNKRFISALKQSVLRKFNGLCAYCGTKDAKHIDHIIPKSIGGSNAAYNLFPACYKCNSMKSNLPISEFKKMFDLSGKQLFFERMGWEISEDGWSINKVQ